MFNITILKMKDIIKYAIGISITLLAIITVSKFFQKDTSKEQKIVQEVKNKFQAISENSLLNCFEQTIPVAANVNEEYKNIASEDDKIESENILQTMLKTQISSIKGMETIEEKAKSEEVKIEVAENQESSSEIKTEETSQKENIELARNRINNRSNYK